MKTTRKMLQRLSWPTDEMTDGQIKCELYRRWFALQSEEVDDEAPLSVASARGIFVSLASEGNLDALCWSPEDEIPLHDVVPAEEEALYLRDPDAGDYAGSERRRSQRRAARELVEWTRLDREDPPATGWLVDCSAEGLAFLVPADDAPLVGERICPNIHSRTQGLTEVGPTLVVRSEQLNPELTLVCVCLEEETLPY